MRFIPNNNVVTRPVITGALFTNMHAAIQLVYCYILTPCMECWMSAPLWNVNTFVSSKKINRLELMIKEITMAQWTNLNRNNSFVNPTWLPLLCEKSGAIHLAQPGLTAGRQAGRQADEIQANFNFFKIRFRVKYFNFAGFNKGYRFITAVQMH